MGAQIAIWKLRSRVPDLRADNRQTVRRRTRYTGLNLGLGILERRAPRGTSTRAGGPAGARRNWFTCHLLRRPLFSPDVAVLWRWNGEECKDAAAHVSPSMRGGTIIGQISSYLALVFHRDSTNREMRVIEKNLNGGGVAVSRDASAFI